MGTGTTRKTSKRSKRNDAPPESGGTHRSAPPGAHELSVREVEGDLIASSDRIVEFYYDLKSFAAELKYVLDHLPAVARHKVAS